jgi:hypothetical protein
MMEEKERVRKEEGGDGGKGEGEKEGGIGVPRPGSVLHGMEDKKDSRPML